MIRTIDFILTLLATLVLALLISGGIHHGKFELAEIDAFGWAFLVFGFVRNLAVGSYLPPNLESAYAKALDFFERYPRKVVAAAISIHVILFTWVLSNRFASFHTNAYDHSYVHQPMWSTLRVGFLHSSLSVNGTYFGEHFSPILAIGGIFYRIWESPYFLFFIQSLVLGASAWLVYRLARAQRLSDKLSVLLSILFLCYQPLRAANTFDFKEDLWFVPIFLSMILAIVEDRPVRFWIFVLLSWTVKENAPIWTLLTGTALLFFGRTAFIKDAKRTKAWVTHGAILSALSVEAFQVINSMILPMFSGSAGQTRFAFRMRQFGETPSAVIHSAITQPGIFISYLMSLYFTKTTLKYFMIVFLPFLHVGRRAVVPMLIAVAAWGLHVFIGITSIGFHYECILIPFLFAAMTAGLATIKDRLNTEILAVIAVGFLLFYGRAPLFHIREFWPTERDLFVSEELAKIPQAASIATQTALHPHLCLRKDAFLFAGTPDADYVIVDMDLSRDRYGTPNLTTDAAAMELDRRYSKVLDKDGLLIWKLTREVAVASPQR